jgi:hypothetical protein
MKKVKALQEERETATESQSSQHKSAVKSHWGAVTLRESARKFRKST